MSIALEQVYVPQFQLASSSQETKVRKTSSSLLQVPTSMPNKSGASAKSHTVAHTTFNQQLSIYSRYTSTSSSVAPAPAATARQAWEEENKGTKLPASNTPGAEVKALRQKKENFEMPVLVLPGLDDLTKAMKAKRYYRYAAPYLEDTTNDPEKRKEQIAQIATLYNWLVYRSSNMHRDAPFLKTFLPLHHLANELYTNPNRKLSSPEIKTIQLWHNKVQYSEYTELNFKFDHEEPISTREQLLKKELRYRITVGLDYILLDNYSMLLRKGEPIISLPGYLRESKTVLSRVLIRIMTAIKAQEVFTATDDEINAITKLYHFTNGLSVAPQRGSIRSKNSRKASARASLSGSAQTPHRFSTPSFVHTSLLPNQPMPSSEQVTASTRLPAPHIRTMRPQPSVATTLGTDSNDATNHLELQARVSDENTTTAHKCIIQ